MSRRLPAALRAYRLFSVAVTPLTPLFLARRLRMGKEHGVRLPERRGVSGKGRPPGPLVWLQKSPLPSGMGYWQTQGFMPPPRGRISS